MVTDAWEIPAEVRQAIRAGAEYFTNGDTALAQALIQTPLGLPVFTLSLGDIERYELKKEAPDGWRCVAVDSTGTALISAEVLKTKQGTLKLASVSRDLVATKAIRLAQQQLGEIKEKYQPRVLRIPALLVELLWLKSKVGESDLIIPIVWPFKDVEVKDSYLLDDFLKVVQPLIARFRNFPGLRENLPSKSV